MVDEEEKRMGNGVDEGRDKRKKNARARTVGHLELLCESTPLEMIFASASSSRCFILPEPFTSSRIRLFTTPSD